MSLLLKMLPQRKKYLLYLVKTDTQSAPHSAFSTQLYTKQQQSADIYGPRWKEAHTSRTFAPDKKKLAALSMLHKAKKAYYACDVIRFLVP